jgi:hypothetical protein
MNAKEAYAAAIDAIDALIDLDDEGALYLLMQYAQQAHSLFTSDPQPDLIPPEYPA